MTAAYSVPDADPRGSRRRMRPQMRQSGARESGFEANLPRSGTRPFRPWKCSKLLPLNELYWIRVVQKRVGVTYYLYRHYDTQTGRWPSRDLIEEKGGLNLYGFVENNGIARWDLLGMMTLMFPPQLIDYYPFTQDKPPTGKCSEGTEVGTQVKRYCTIYLPRFTVPGSPGLVFEAPGEKTCSQVWKCTKHCKFEKNGGTKDCGGCTPI